MILDGRKVSAAQVRAIIHRLRAEVQFHKDFIVKQNLSLNQEIDRAYEFMHSPDGAECVMELAEDECKKSGVAVAMGRRGGVSGGHARAAALSPERRSEIARAAAAARWGKP
jgi:hypothetical protein